MGSLGAGDASPGKRRGLHASVLRGPQPAWAHLGWGAGPQGDEWSLWHTEGWLGLGHLPVQLSSTLRQRQGGCSCFGWVTAVPRGTSVSEAVDTELAEPLAQSG